MESTDRQTEDLTTEMGSPSSNFRCRDANDCILQDVDENNVTKNWIILLWSTLGNAICTNSSSLTLPSTAATLQVSQPSRTVSAAAGSTGLESGWSTMVGISRGSDDSLEDAMDADDILQ